MYLPAETSEAWPVPACDQRAADRAFWERVARTVSDAPSTLRFLVCDVWRGEPEEPHAEDLRENMYLSLENDSVEKLARGLILTERTLPYGVRRGLVAAIDLEQFSFARGTSAPVRAACEVKPADYEAYLAVRRETPLEFPHTVALFRDKKNKLLKRLAEEDLELLYEVDLMEGGGKLKGYFVPEPYASLAAEMMHSRGEPCFAIAEGNGYVAAAKAYWEELKPSLKREELATHPARFTLAEFVNVYDDAVRLLPVHRIVRDTDAEALAAFLSANMKCERRGSVLRVKEDFPKAAAHCDALIAEFVRASGGTAGYVQGAADLRAAAAEEDCLGVELPAFDGEDLFSFLKEGSLPAHAFTLGAPNEKRYHFEGREISYD